MKRVYQPKESCSARFMVSCPAKLDEDRRKLKISGSEAVQRGFKEIIAEIKGEETTEKLRKKIEYLTMKYEEAFKENENLKQLLNAKR